VSLDELEIISSVSDTHEYDPLLRVFLLFDPRSGWAGRLIDAGANSHFAVTER